MLTGAAQIEALLAAFDEHRPGRPPDPSTRSISTRSQLGAFKEHPARHIYVGVAIELHLADLDIDQRYGDHMHSRWIILRTTPSEASSSLAWSQEV